MNTITKAIRNTVVSLGVMGCLAFGSTQVLASSTPTQPGYNTCSNPIPYCKGKCGDFGAVYMAGKCLCCG